MEANTLDVESVRFKLAHAVTAHDIRQSKSTRGRYNPYALSLYLGAVESTCEAIVKGATVESAIRSNFNDRLLTVCLKACGLPI